MNTRLVVGVIIPLILVVLIGFLGSWGFGLSINEEFRESLGSEDIFLVSEGFPNASSPLINVGVISINNSYFLPRRVLLPSKIACLIDNEGEKPELVAGFIKYSEGSVVYTNPKELYRGVYSRVKYSSLSVEVGAGEVKEVNVFLIRDSYFDISRTELIKRYSEYDKLVIPKSASAGFVCSSSSVEGLEDFNEINLVL